MIDARRTELSRLALGQQFAYVFDVGDYWAHLCTVGPERADPVEAYGLVPDRPAATITADVGRATTGRAPCDPTPSEAICRPPFLPGGGAGS